MTVPSSGGWYVRPAELQHPLFSRYISLLGQLIVLLGYLVLDAQEVLAMCPPCTKRIAQSSILHIYLLLYGKHCK